jgi:cobalt-precorrin 5A hydrolase/precorrin-3B C17-methyltransferase
VDGAGDPAPLLAGGPVRIRSALTWPLPPLLDGDGPVVEVTDRLAGEDDRDDRAALLLRPPSLVVGVGAIREAPPDRVLAMIESTVAGAGLALGSVRALVTAEVKSDDSAIRAVARERDWPLLTFSSATLAAIEVPNPSAYVAAAIGTPSVAEAGALAVGPDAELVVPKRHDGVVTVAVSRLAPRGWLAALGAGGGPDAVLRRARWVVSDGGLPELPPGTRAVRLDDAADAVRRAVGLARQGHAVAVRAAGVGTAELRAALQSDGRDGDRTVEMAG